MLLVSRPIVDQSHLFSGLDLARTPKPGLDLPARFLHVSKRNTAMVNIFTTKKKNQKSDTTVDDSQARLQGSMPSGATSSNTRKTAPKEMDELPQLRDYPAAKYGPSPN